MSSTYYRVVKPQSLAIRRKLEQVWALLIRETATDELGRRVADEVLRNLKTDCAMKNADLRDFILEIIDKFDNGLILDLPSAKSAFLNACYSRQRRGLITSSSTEFWIVLTEKKLLAAVNKANSEPSPYVMGVAWTTFLNNYHSNNLSRLTQILGDAEINSSGYQVFTTFAHPSRMLSFPNDPDLWSDAATACAALGLSKDWPGYRAGDHLWLLKYEFGNYMEQYLPTFADADWRSLFRPSKSRRTAFGMTIPLGPLRRAGIRRRHPDEGMPEVVHKNSRFLLYGSIVFSSTNNLKLLDVKDLGIHSGW